MQIRKPTTNISSSRRPAWAGLCFFSALCATAASAQIAAQTGDQASAPAPDEVVKLAPLEVGGQQTSGYNVTTASTATRTNTALIDIPQTVDIVTNQFWADLHSTTWDESFSYMANVEVRNRFAGFGDTVNIRGFQTLSNSMAEDGILVGDQHYKRDLSGYDRLEIVKGPPSAVQGRASGFGYFNYILKKPTLGDN